MFSNMEATCEDDGEVVLTMVSTLEDTAQQETYSRVCGALVQQVVDSGGNAQEVLATIRQFDILSRQEEELHAAAVAAAKAKELGSFKGNDVFREVPVSQAEGHKKIQTLWVIKWKPLTTEEVKEAEKSGRQAVRKIKARLTIKGCQDPDKDLLDTESPTATTMSQRLVFFEAAQRPDWCLEAWDISSAFLLGDKYSPADKRTIYVRPPADVCKPGTVWELLKAAYGLNDAPRRWNARLKKALLKFGLTENPLDPCSYTLFKSTDGEPRPELFLTTHVDDLLLTGSKRVVRELQAFLEKEFGQLTIEKEVFTHLGCEVSRAADGTVKVTQKLYAENVKAIPLTMDRRKRDMEDVTEEERELLMSGVGSLAWTARMVRPDLSCTVSHLQSASSKAQVRHLKEFNKAVKKLKDYEPDAVLTFCKLQAPYTIQAIADAGFANTESQKSQAGQMIRICEAGKGPGRKGCLLEWRSRPLRRVVRSTLGAETLSMVEAVDLAIHLGDLHLDMTHLRPKGTPVNDESFRLGRMPIDVFTDCRSLWDLKQTSRVALEKNLMPDVAFLRAMHAERKLRDSIWVPTNEMICDELTKDMTSGLALAALKGTWACSGTHRTARTQVEELLVCDSCTTLCSRRGFDLAIGHTTRCCPQGWLHEMVRCSRPGSHSAFYASVDDNTNCCSPFFGA